MDRRVLLVSLLSESIRTYIRGGSDLHRLTSDIDSISESLQEYYASESLSVIEKCSMHFDSIIGGMELDHRFEINEQERLIISRCLQNIDDWSSRELRRSS